MKPHVSIIMPAYNAAHTIEESIQSVLAQTYEAWELVVVDDGSTDGTQAVVSQLLAQEPRIRLLQQPTNQGVAAARNRGIAQTTGVMIAFLDSDDLWEPSKLTKQVALGASLSYTATAYLKADGTRASHVLAAKTRTTRRDLLKQNVMSCSSVMVSREALGVLRFDQTVKPLHEDYVLWLNLLANGGEAVGLSEPLLVYRLSATSKSAGRLRSAHMIFNAYVAVGYHGVYAGLLTLRYAIPSIHKRRRIHQ